MTGMANRDARRVQGLLLAVVLVASQASAWFHATVISHVACLEHGEAVHAPAIPGPAAAAVGPDAAAGVRADLAAVSGHDHCANAALLRWRDFALAVPAAPALLSPPERSMPFAAACDDAPTAVLYLIAPKTSPPRAVA
jgi:hypothetical protein